MDDEGTGAQTPDMAAVRILEDFLVRAQATAVPEYFTLPQVAEMIGFSEAALRKWRQLGIGPVPTVFSNRIRYAREDVVRWLDERREQRPASSE